MTSAENLAVDRIGDYRIVAELGRGGMSVVYKVERDGHTYAIKVLRASAHSLEDQASLRIRREAAAIARINHPALVRIHEVGEVAGVPYLVMEFASGQSLDALLAAGPLEEARVVRLALTLASALVEVHRLGLVHRDVKPRNILVDEDHIKLIDFGLVQRQGSQELAAGTLAYAAPEQLRLLDTPVDGRADLYSLGVTLFQCLTGRTPFTAESESKFLERLATQVAPDVRALCPKVRPALATLIARLLAKDPDDRYQSARGLCMDLKRLEELDAEFRTTGTLSLDREVQRVWFQDDFPLVGRQHEAKVLESSWEFARRGEGGVVLIEGEGGSGKTRLVREILPAIQESKYPVLIGKCQEYDAVPFGPLREAIDRLLSRIEGLSGLEREDEMGRIRRAAGELGPHLGGLSSHLARILGESIDVSTFDPEVARQLFYRAIADFLINLAEANQGALLVIDDIQWLHEASLHALEHLALRLSSSRILFVAMSRNDAESEHARSRFVEVMGRYTAVRRLELGPLGEDEVGTLIAAHLRGGVLRPDAVKRLAALSGGNPFHIAEYVRALLDQGLLRPVDGVWDVDVEGLTDVNLPQDVIYLVVRRMKLLSLEARRLLGMAGLLGLHFSAELLSDATHLLPRQTTQWLEEGVREALLEHSSEDRFNFVHDRVREAAMELLSPEEQKDGHHAIALALEQQRGSSREHLYALAHHYGLGHVEQDPDRVLETHLQAGQVALSQHAYEDAYRFLSTALEVSSRAASGQESLSELYMALAKTCVATGRPLEAQQCVSKALPLARSQEDRFRLQQLLTLVLAGQGRNEEALASLFRTFDVLGKPFPRSLPMQLLAMIGCLFLAVVLRLLGVGFGRAQGEGRKKRLILSELHYAGSMVALFEGRPVLMTQFIFRDFLNAHFLGNSSEAAVAYAVFGAALGLMQLKRLSRRFTSAGVSMAEQRGDPRAFAVCRAYQAVGLRWSGEFREAQRDMFDAIEKLVRHQPGSWYTAMMNGEMAYSMLHAGMTRAVIEHIRQMAPHVARTHNLMYQYNTLAVLYSQLMITGQNGEATELWQDLEKLFAQIGQTAYARLARVENLLAIQVERGETGPEVDKNIEDYLALRTEDYYGVGARIFVGHARLNQFLSATSTEARARARKRLEEAILGLNVRAMVPLFRCHVYLFKAAIAREEGKLTQAAKLLSRAAILVGKSGSCLGAFYLSLERARLARAMRDPSERHLAQAAYEMAREQGWRATVSRVAREFSLEQGASSRRNEGREGRGPSESILNSSRSEASHHGSRTLLSGERYAQALLEISLASASSWEPGQQATLALSEMARVLGAEQAFCFLYDEQKKELELTAKYAVSGQEGQEDQHSTSVVRAVWETGEPVIVSGSGREGGLSSESMVAFDLRSIMAAPLKVRDKLIGVVYLHNRLARGMFHDEQVALLQAMANHIAIAVETARAARLEVQRRELQRDLELTGAVQAMLLPREAVFSQGGLAGAGWYEAATHCGGDWWWHRELSDGSLEVLVGDVTGHGAPSAMVTATIAGAYQTLSRAMPEAEPMVILRELHRCVQGMGEQYLMTLSLVKIDLTTGQLELLNAGGPPVFLQRKGARALEGLVAPGTPLGSLEALRVGRRVVDLREGDRVLVCTDGLLEMRLADGKMMSTRLLTKTLAEIASYGVGEARNRLGERLRALRGSHSLEDDVTFVVLDYPSKKALPSA